MIELLSRHSDIFGEPHGIVIEPLPIGEDVSSLSAIIMDDDFIISPLHTASSQTEYVMPIPRL